MICEGLLPSHTDNSPADNSPADNSPAALLLPLIPGIYHS